MKSLPFILSLVLACSCSWFGTGVKPQLPSNDKEADSTSEAALRSNQVLAEQASEQLRVWAQAANDTLTAQGEQPFVFYDNGCWIRVISAPQGEPAAEGQMVGIVYTLQLPNGTIAEEVEKTIKAGRKQTLDAIDYVITLLPQGSEAHILAPWQLLYGRQGSDNVPPYSQALIKLNIKDRSQAN